MTEIVNGKLVYNELTKNANGGTELMARRMVEHIPNEYLEGVQIIHSRVRDLEPDMKRILVCHDLANDPEVAKLTDHNYRKNFDKIVFVSNWQQHTYNMVLGVPFAESAVIRNGITVPTSPPAPFNKDEPIRLIYHTTPHRGLELLIPAFKELSKHFNVHLDVFSSFKAYGWGERDEQFKKLFEEIDSTPNITNHGFQPNDVIRSALEGAHVFAYPNIWPETSCIAMIEALCHGLIVVNSNLGALPETTIGLSSQYMYHESHQHHVNAFYRKLYEAVNWVHTFGGDPTFNQHREYVHKVASNYYNFDLIKIDWIKVLKEVKSS